MVISMQHFKNLVFIITQNTTTIKQHDKKKILHKNKKVEYDGKHISSILKIVLVITFKVTAIPLLLKTGWNQNFTNIV